MEMKGFWLPILYKDRYLGFRESKKGIILTLSNKKRNYEFNLIQWPDSFCKALLAIFKDVSRVQQFTIQTEHGEIKGKIKHCSNPDSANITFHFERSERIKVTKENITEFLDTLSRHWKS